MRGTKKYLSIVALAVCLTLVAFGVTSAITNGQPDGDVHPYVGAVGFWGNVDGQPTQWWCTGTLVAKRLVLTAGHCTDGAAGAVVSFDSIFSEASEFVAGTPVTYPGYCAGCDSGLTGVLQRDLGLVVLDKPAKGVTPAALPVSGLVDGLAMKSGVTLVGYGATGKVMAGEPPDKAVWMPSPVRLFAPAEVIAKEAGLSAQFMALTANPGDGSGGACFGDSGGPALLEGEGTPTILAVNSFAANGNCAGQTYAYRVDRPEVLAWLDGFLK